MFFLTIYLLIFTILLGYSYCYPYSNSKHYYMFIREMYLDHNGLDESMFDHLKPVLNPTQSYDYDELSDEQPDEQSDLNDKID